MPCQTQFQCTGLADGVVLVVNRSYDFERFLETHTQLLAQAIAAALDAGCGCGVGRFGLEQSYL